MVEPLGNQVAADAGKAITVDVDTDRRLQEAGWLVSRLGWLAMLAVIVAAVMGFSGRGGPYSRHQESAGGVAVDSPAVSRWQSSDRLTIEFSAAEEPTVLVPASFADVFEIETVSPAPKEVFATPGGLYYRFAFRGGAGQRSVDFSVRAEKPGYFPDAGGFVVGGQRFEPFPIVVLP